jgi:SRSO17 transposase
MVIVAETCPAPACNLSSRDVEGLMVHLAAYHAHFAAAFARPEQAWWAEMYLRGLLSNAPRKSIEPRALALGLPIRPMQHFIGQSAWRVAPLLDRHQALLAQTLSKDDGVYLVDESGRLKQGDDSVGVGRQ